jgi:hypothetical protein
MCHLNMNNAPLALEDATTAEGLDPTYVKTYYRKAAAYKALNQVYNPHLLLSLDLFLLPSICLYYYQLSDAKDALLKGISLKPGNMYHTNRHNYTD